MRGNTQVGNKVNRMRNEPHRDFKAWVAVARGWRWLRLQGARRKMPAGVLDSTLRTFFERNAVNMAISAAAVEHW